MRYASTIIINKEGKWFVARSLELGVVSQGRSVEEAQKNLKEALELYLEDRPRLRSKLPRRAPLITSLELGRV